MWWWVGCHGLAPVVPPAPEPAPIAAAAPAPAPTRRPTDGGRYELSVHESGAARLGFRVLAAEPVGVVRAAVVVDGEAWAVTVTGDEVVAVGPPAVPGALVQVAVHAAGGVDRAAWALATAP